MIEIQDITTYNIDDIVNLLLDEKQQPFQIYFPKSTVLFSSSNDDIADDYARLAYVGYKLNQLSEKLEYTFVQPCEHESILFTITVRDFVSLSKVLLDLSSLYDNNEDEYDSDWGNIFEYIEDLKQGKHIPVCPEFIEIHNEYVNTDKESNNQ